MNKAILLLSWIMTWTCLLRAQVPSYQCSLTNDSLLTATVYEFDIYLKNTSATTFELGNFQAGIGLNSLILNGGTLNAEILPGSSELNSNQQPAAVIFSASDNCLKIAPKSPPSFNGGTLIPSAGAGSRICRLRLTNTLPFGPAKPNLAFNFSVFPYNTVVSAFDRTTQLNVNITLAASHLVTGLNNPLMNVPVAAYVVSGSGAYCQGSTGIAVSLSNSESEIRYQLKKNGSGDGGEVTGTGNPLTWPDRTAGFYIVTARRAGTYLTNIMSGDATITADDPTLGGSITGGTTIFLGSSTDTLRIENHLGTIFSWQKQVDGSGFTDIPATSLLTTYQEIPASPGVWEYRATVKNGSCQQEYAVPAIVVVSAVPLTRSWTGTIDEKWNKAGNWSPTGVPGMSDDVIIPATAANMPVVRVQGLNCNEVLVKSGASLTIIPGIVLTVNGSIILE